MTEHEIIRGLEAQIRHDQAVQVAQKIVKMLIFTMDAPEEITEEVENGFAALMRDATNDFIVLSDFQVDADTAATSVGVMGTVLLEVITNLPTYIGLLNAE